MGADSNPRLRRDAALAIGQTSATAVAWRYRGSARVSVVAKASFTFSPDLAMPRTEPQEIFRAEVHPNNHPGKSIRFASDLAPYLPRADVLLTGHAYAPRGGGTETLPVRLGIFDGPRVVLDKTVVVRKAGGVDKVPLVYERTYGGIGYADNPLGVGATEPGTPSLFDMMNEQRPACFAPIASAWSARARLLGATSKKALEQPVADVPEGFDFAYFQSAPADQRVDYLRGDEWIVVDGVHPLIPRLRVRLPGARGIARIHGLAAFGVTEGQPLALHADTLRIDTDEELCTITFRGTFPVTDEDALGEVTIAVGVETPGRPIAWPDVVARTAGSGVPTSTETMPPTYEQFESVREDVRAGTLAIDGDAPAPVHTLPFAGAASNLAAPASKKRAALGTGTEIASGGPPEELRDVLPFLFEKRAEPAAAEAKPPPAVAKPIEKIVEKKEGSPFRADTSKPAPKVAPPPAATPLPSSKLKTGLYGRFK
jgi:hypothetical protein